MKRPRPPERGIATGVAIMLTSGTGNQVGAAIGAHAFPVIGPVGVVAVRQLVAAAVLLPAVRPPVRRFTWAQWWPTILLGLVFSVMNLSLYVAIERIGLGLAVTLEFLGPLAVALGSSRTRIDLLCAFAAAAGVVILVQPGPTTDVLGVGAALIAAGCWAGYILLNRLLGVRLPGLQAPAVASGVAALIYLPVAVVLLVTGTFTWLAAGQAICAGLLCSVLPYACDLIALRRVPTQFFGVFMSVNPVLAALSGIVILDQVLVLHEWVGIAIVVVTNAVAMAHAAGRGGIEIRDPA